MNILVCEDDKDIQDLLEIVIESMDLNYIECSSRDTLYKKLEKEKIDLIILDYWLKHKKADKILESLKSDYKDIPVILMSAIADLPELADKFKVNDFIKKPFNIAEFRDKINALLKI